MDGTMVDEDEVLMIGHIYTYNNTLHEYTYTYLILTVTSEGYCILYLSLLYYFDHAPTYLGYFSLYQSN